MTLAVGAVLISACFFAGVFLGRPRTWLTADERNALRRRWTDRRRRIGQQLARPAPYVWQTVVGLKRLGSRHRQVVWRLVIAVALPALAVAVMHPGGFILTVFLILLPAAALSAFVRDGRLYAVGVVLSVAAALAVSAQIANTDDAQAGLAILGLPVYMGGIIAVVVVVEARMSSARR